MKNWQGLRGAKKRTSVRGKKKEVSISTLEMEAAFEAAKAEGLKTGNQDRRSHRAEHGKALPQGDGVQPVPERAISRGKSKTVGSFP